MRVYKHFSADNQVTLFNGDCLELLREIPDEAVDLIISSPPYCMKKAYENPKDDIETFQRQHEKIFDDLYRVLKPGGSLCWQVGYHICNAHLFPLDYFVYNIFTEKSTKLDRPLILRNRIVWTFGHGLNSTHRFSGRHETILWFTKGNDYHFDLDNVRIPQKYPGKRAYKGSNQGNLSGNPLGKNPSDVWIAPNDVWDIPNVKAQHVEKTEHPCQFPVAIPQRLIKALTPTHGVVLDPFAGSGTSGVAAILEGRKFIGAELLPEYHDISTNRLEAAINGSIKFREDVPVIAPNLKSAVAKMPEEFVKVRGSSK